MFMDYAKEFYKAFLDRTIARKYVSAAVARRLAGFAVAQAKFESANFSSNVFKKNLNPIGYKYYSGSLWQIGSGVKSPEGDSYAKFASVGDAARELADWIKRRRSDFMNVDSLAEYVSMMKKNGYFGDHESIYFSGVASYYDDSVGNTEDVSSAMPTIGEEPKIRPLAFGWWLVIAALGVVGIIFFRTSARAVRVFSKLV